MSISVDLQSARDFLKALGHDNDLHSFQTFSDKGGNLGGLTRIYHGSIDEYKSELISLNSGGAGIFVTVNQTNLLGRKKENITRVTAVWQDDDTGFNGDYPLKPNIVVQTSLGKFQRYWLVDDLTQEQHGQVMERMVSDYGADNGAKDLARILRVPGFFHNKGDPFLVHVIGAINPTPYRQYEVMQAFPPVGKKKSTAAVRVESGLTDVPPGSRNSSLTSFAGKLWNSGINGQELIAAMRARNDSFTHPLDDEELLSICGSAERNFTTIDDPESIVKQLNREYAVITFGGKVRIMYEYMDDYGQPTQAFMTKQDFHLKIANLKKIWTKRGDVTAAHFWICHKDRRVYNGLTFNPKSAPEGYYNLWRGFAVEPSEGDCSLFLNHCSDVVCNGDKKHYIYLLSWLAHLVQRPEQKIGVAIILRGLKGTGKGVFMNTIGELFGKHYTLINHQKHLTGAFNAHLADTLLLGGDEITWGGDIKGEGPLKSLITEDQVMLERKGIDAVQIPSFLRLMICTNNDWSVPASADERRYFVLDVSDKRKKDFGYFKSIKAQMDNGGKEAFLQYLLDYQIPDHIELRDPPRTAGLHEQVELSLRPVENWWLECLLNRYVLFPSDGGEIYRTTMTNRKYLDGQSYYHGTDLSHQSGVLYRNTTTKSAGYSGMSNNEITRTTLAESFRLHQKKEGLKPRSASTTVGIFLNKLYPKSKSAINYDLPDLASLRNEFQKKTLGDGYEWEWETGDCSPVNVEGVSGLSLGYPQVKNALVAFILRTE